jgi:hypothetical protein
MVKKQSNQKASSAESCYLDSNQKASFLVTLFHNAAHTSEALNAANEFLMSSIDSMAVDECKGTSNINARLATATATARSMLPI